MDRIPDLRLLHAAGTLVQGKLETFRTMSTSEIKATLLPGQAGSLKVRPDGTVLDGHHRIAVLTERGEDVHRLPREIMERES